MSNETKRDVFEKVLNEWDDLVHKYGLQGEEAYGYCEFDVTLSKYEKDYDNALPDDLPVIPKCVSEELRAEYGKNSLLDELVWASQDALPSSEISEWINSNEAVFGEAWSRGLWKIKETGEIVKLNVTK